VFRSHCLERLERRDLLTDIVGGVVVAPANRQPGALPVAALYFLKLGDIQGDATVVGHEHEIQLRDINWGVADPGTAPVPQFDPLVVDATMSRASPLVFQAAATGAPIAQATLTAVRIAGGTPVDFAKWTLSGVTVTSYVSADGVERYALAYDKATMAYQPDGTPDTAISATYDLKAQDQGGVVVAPANRQPPEPSVAPQYFLKLGDIEGDATVVGHEHQIAVQGIDWGVARATGSSTAQFDPLVIDTTLGRASPLVFQAAATGAPIAQATLTAVRIGDTPVDFAKWTLSGVTVTSYVSADGVERYALAYDKATMTYQPDGTPDTAITATYDLKSPDGAGVVVAPANRQPFGLPAVEYFLKLGDIQGDATFVGYEHQIAVVNVLWGIARPTGSFTPRVDPLVIDATIGRASPLVFQAAATGNPIRGATLTAVRMVGGTPVGFATWKLSGVTVTSYVTADGAERYALAYDKATMAYQPDGTPDTAISVTITGLHPDVGDREPTDIALSSTSVAENQPAGTVVGTLSTTDPDAGDTFTYTLVGGPGDTDNASFTIGAGGTLMTAESFNYEARSAYSIRVRSTDAGGKFTERAFLIHVTDVNEAPTIAVPGAQTAYEDVAQLIAGVKVGDPEGNNLAVTLAVSHGTLKVGTMTGLTITGNGTATVSLSGSLATLNAALAGLVYQGSLNYSGTDVLTITASDGKLSTKASVVLTIKSAAQQATDLQAKVAALQTATPRVLNGGQANALIVSLNLKGNNGDVGKVQSFLEKVRDLLRTGILTQDQADGLLGPGEILLQSVTRR
jgi:type VI protein secretion system component Hcp